jgi:hypothetical protein
MDAVSDRAARRIYELMGHDTPEPISLPLAVRELEVWLAARDARMAALEEEIADMRSMLEDDDG